MTNNIVAVDFDGVLHDYQNPVEGKRMGKPIEGAEAGIEELMERGYTIVIYTAKAATEGGKQAVEDWLDFYGIDYNQVTAVKPNALIYIDDRAIRFTSWPQVFDSINSLTGYEE